MGGACADGQLRADSVSQMESHGGLNASAKRPVFLVPITPGDAGAYARYLMAIPAAVSANGKPVVLAVEPENPWRPELIDLLKRYGPTELVAVGSLKQGGEKLAELKGASVGVAVSTASLDATACELAGKFFSKPQSVVACTFEDRASALQAATLAGRLGVPLVPCTSDGFSPLVQETLRKLGIKTVRTVGADAPALVAGFEVELLATASDVAACLERTLAGHGEGDAKTVAYVAAVNASDQHVAHAKDLSLAAAVLAVGRGGAIAPTPEDVQWKQPVATDSEVLESPPGAHASSKGWRLGTFGDGVDAGSSAIRFVTGFDPATGRAFMQMDVNGNGQFGDAGEGPLFTGSEIEIGGRKFAISLDADEHTRAKSVWLTSPTASEIVESIAKVRSAVSKKPQTLCIVGWPDTLPMAIISDTFGIDTDLVSDVPLAQTDDDPFVDLAYARFIAEDVYSATLVACRGLIEGEFADRAYADRFATAEWTNPVQPVIGEVGFETTGHHAGGHVIDGASPLTGAGWILHAAHSMWTILGETYAADSSVLLSPCLVQTDGCSVAALDMDKDRKSVAARMLRNGAMAFAGSARRNTAQGELFASEFTNAIAAGQSVGEAHQRAVNRAVVAMLARNESGGGIYKYQLHIASTYGDPGVVFTRGGSVESARVASAAKAKPAHMEVDGSSASVVMTGPWHRMEYAPLEEWGCTAPKLYTWRAQGVGAESTWYPPEKRNQDQLVFTAEARTKQAVTGVEAMDDANGEWGFDGKSYIDVHEDGTRSIYWRVKLIDFDMNRGEIRMQRERAAFRLK